MPAFNKTVTVVIRIALGAVFVGSSIGKIADPAAFAVIVANYQVLPSSMVTITALFFPWIEAICGLALVFCRFEKGAALLVNLMLILFIGLNLFNGYRGLNIACGCFSLASKESSSIAGNTFRNLILLAAGAWILYFPQRPATSPRMEPDKFM
jgi:uncharacterized membrane protein YphA (DoxX/SURF4 family)